MKRQRDSEDRQSRSLQHPPDGAVAPSERAGGGAPESLAGDGAQTRGGESARAAEDRVLSP